MSRPDGPVGLISNPRSGHNRDRFAAVEAIISRQPAIHHITTDSADAIDGALAELADAGVAVLAINGGDGTASAVLGQLLESGRFPTPPLVALLPGGTANMNAGDIGVRGSLPQAVGRFCRWCEGPRETAGRIARRRLLKITTGADPAARYGMFLGGGAVIHGTDYAHREIHSRGLRDDFSLALGTLRTVWGVLRDDPAFNRHIELELQLDGRDCGRFDTLILAVSTLERLAFGMRPFWADGPGNIRLTLIEQGASRFARTFLSIIRGRPSRNAVAASGYHSHNANSLRIAMDGRINLDGELLETGGHVDIGATEALEFLQL